MTYHDAAMNRFSQWWLRAVRSGFGYADVERTSRHYRFPLYRKEMVRALFWGALLPVAIVMLAVVDANALWGLLAYPLQTTRIAVRRGPSSLFSWKYAAMMTLCKFAEFQGIIEFWISTWRVGKANKFEYKRQNK
jgi:hypothetical protein